MRGALLAVLVLLAPVAFPAFTVAADGSEPGLAREDIPPMPGDVMAVAAAWREAGAEAAAVLDGTAFEGDAGMHLARIDGHVDAGRFRSAFHEAVNLHTLITFNEVWSAVQELGSESAKRAYLLQWVDASRVDADAQFETFRRALNELDGNLTTQTAIERALYAGALVMDGLAGRDAGDAYRFTLERGDVDVDASFVRGLVSAVDGPRVMFLLPGDLLAVALAKEGVLPVVDVEKYRAYADSVKIPLVPGAGRPELEVFRELLDSTVGTNQDLLAIAGVSAMRRADAIAEERMKFGDAVDRGHGAWDVLNGNVNRTLGQPILESFTASGFDGLIAMDAFDFAWSVKDGSQQAIPLLVRAWIDLYHAEWTAGVYRSWSTVAPPETESGDEGVVTVGARAQGIAIAAAAVAVTAGLAVALVRWGRRG